MEQKVQLKYIHKSLQIGLVSWREAYLLSSCIEQLLVELYNGNKVYRKKGSPKRIYYKKLKGGHVKTEKRIKIQVPEWMI